MPPTIPPGNTPPLQDAADLGRLVRATRRAQRLTQLELAGASGVGLRFVVELEKGKPTCELDKALRVVRMLGITLTATPPVPPEPAP